MSTSNYRDTVRDMMNDIKSKSTAATTTSTTTTTERSNSVPNEEDLLDDILDLEEGAPIDDEEAEELLADSDHENGITITSLVFENWLSHSVGIDEFFIPFRYSVKSILTN